MYQKTKNPIPTTRRAFLKTTVTATAAATLTSPHTLFAKPKPKPNILFIIADDMQRYMFNCLPEGKGKNLTPNLDRLAREGVLMMGQHVSSPVCTPSRYSCLTGRYASRSRSDRFVRATERAGQTVITWNTHIVESDATLPKMLKKAGYATGMVGKNHTIEAPSGYKKVPYGADPAKPEVASQLRRNGELSREGIRRAGFDFAASIYHNNPDANCPRALAVHNLDWIAQGALEFLDAQKEGPFFLYFASTVPHGPMEAARSWNADPRLTADGILEEAPKVLPPRETLPLRVKKAGITEGGKENLLWLDDAVGALIERLEKQGALDNTIIFFFNDQGQAAKGTVYQGGVSDPSIIWRKGGFPCGSVSETLVSNIDFAPTILDFAGGQAPEGHFDGVSFRKVLEGSKEEIHESLFFELGYARGLRKGPWKYIALRYPESARNMSLADRKKALDRFNAKQIEHGSEPHNTDPAAPFSHISLIPGGGGAEHASTGKYTGYYDADQLYNLDKDPGEMQNLSSNPKHAAKLEEMKQEMRKYLASLPGTLSL